MAPDAPVNDLDRLLSSEEALVPSSGFTARVMEAVSDAAAAPEPLPFPWGRFLTGLFAGLVSLASAATLVTSPWALALGEALRPVAGAAPAIGYAAIVAVASLAWLHLQARPLERDM